MKAFKRDTRAVWSHNPTAYLVKLLTDSIKKIKYGFRRNKLS